MSQAAATPDENDVISISSEDIIALDATLSVPAPPAAPEVQIQNLITEVEAFRSKTATARNRESQKNKSTGRAQTNPALSGEIPRPKLSAAIAENAPAFSIEADAPPSDDLTDLIEDDIVSQANAAPPGPEIIEVPEVNSRDADTPITTIEPIKISTVTPPLIVQDQKASEPRSGSQPLAIPSERAPTLMAHAGATPQATLPFDLQLQGYSTVRIQFSDLESKVIVERTEDTLLVRIPGHAEFKLPLPQEPKKKAA